MHQERFPLPLLVLIVAAIASPLWYKMSFVEKVTPATGEPMRPASTAALSKESQVPCRMHLARVFPESGRGGDTIRLQGSWGRPSPIKVPVINKGHRNDLEVLSWDEAEIVARIPPELAAGRYRVGVYCIPNPGGTMWSSGFRDFDIITVSREQ